MGGVTDPYGRDRTRVESWTPQKHKIKENNQKPKPKPKRQGQRNNLTRQARKRGGADIPLNGLLHMGACGEEVVVV